MCAIYRQADPLSPPSHNVLLKHAYLSQKRNRPYSVKLEYDRERESEVGQKVYEQILSIVAVVVVLVVVLRANVWKKNVHSCTDVYL